MTFLGDPATTLPVIFAALMGISILLYVILDGFDLGIGILFPLASEAEKEPMIATIGPFWDANETWLVLAIGLLLVAFPTAHGIILTALYLPVAIMLLGLILRGVAFKFRSTAPAQQKPYWNWAFFAGSLLTALSQGFMLGLYITGLTNGWAEIAFSLLIAICVAGAYAAIGAAWLLIKTSGSLQQKAIVWARRSFWTLIGGFAIVSIATPLVSSRIFDKWFSIPEVILLAPLPIMSALFMGIIWMALKNLPDSRERWIWVPFAASIAVFTLAFVGLAYSFYPYVIPDKLTIYEAASAPESLFVILILALFVLPTILAYNALVYFLFRGKSEELRYD